MTINLDSVALILGTIYLYYAYGYNSWLILLVVWGLCMWSIHTGANEDKELVKAKTVYYLAKAKQCGWDET